MLQTFEFLIYIWKSEELKEVLLTNMESQKEKEILIKEYLLEFDFNAEKIRIDCYRDDYEWKHKVVPAEITFETLKKLIKQEFEEIEIRLEQ